MADIFDLIGRMRVEGADKVKSDLASVSKSGEDTQSKLGGALSKVGGVVKTVGKVAVGAVTAAAGGIGAITKGSIEQYAQYEQLVGGVQKLFGTSGQSLKEYAASQGKSVEQVRSKFESLQNSQSTVMKNAAKAFKTAGMSSNEYMETVTSFSASLISGLKGDTEAAAKYADTAIRDMSDNANTFGTSIGDIQNAYNGFAKGNYTMLDNLKLGYGGTEAEMVRLMNDSGVLKEKIKSMDDVTFDQMIAAIHKTQQKMKISGTTAREAAGTIEGSLNSTKAAWANLLTGMGDDSQNFNKLLKDFLNSAGHLIDNVTPRIKMIFDAIPEAIAKIAPKIPGLLQAVLPGLISAAISLVASLAAQLPQILSVLKTALFTALDAIVAAVGEKAPGLAEPLKTAFDGIKGAIDLLTTHFDKIVIAVGAAATAFGAFKLLSFVGEAGSAASAIGKMTTALKAGTVAKIADKAETLALQALYAKDAVLMAASTAKTIALTAAQKAAAVAQKALNLVMNANPMGIIITVIALLVTAFITLWTTNEDFRNAVIKIWNSIKETATKVFQAIGDFIKNVWNGIKSTTSTVWNAIKSGVTTAINAVKKTVTTVFNAIKTVATNVWNGIKSTTSSVWNGIKSTVSKVVNGIKSAVSSTFNGLKSTVSSVWNGIKTAITNPINTAKSAVSTAIGKIKSIINGAHLSLPHFKLPHFKINGGKLPWGIGGKGTAPSIAVDWYAKGGIFDKATILPNSNGMIGVGEAGAEAVTPIDVLLGYVRTAVAEQNAGLREEMRRMYDLQAQYLPQMANMQMVTDTGALVGQLAPQMDRRLGRIYENQGRGRA